MSIYVVLKDEPNAYTEVELRAAKAGTIVGAVAAGALAVVAGTQATVAGTGAILGGMVGVATVVGALGELGKAVAEGVEGVIPAIIVGAGVGTSIVLLAGRAGGGMVAGAGVVLAGVEGVDEGFLSSYMA